MSNSLVQKSLELLDYQEVKQGRVKKSRRSKGIFNLIPINQRLISRQRKSNKDIAVNRSSRLTIYEAKRRLEAKSDPTEENIKKLLLLGNNRLDSETADKILERATNKRYVLREEKKEEESTAFTEEDFKKFEAEYFDE